MVIDAVRQVGGGGGLCLVTNAAFAVVDRRSRSNSTINPWWRDNTSELPIWISAWAKTRRRRRRRRIFHPSPPHHSILQSPHQGRRCNRNGGKDSDCRSGNATATDVAPADNIEALAKDGYEEEAVDGTAGADGLFDMRRTVN